MRAIAMPIDASRLVLPFAGTVRPVMGWLDGKSTGEQETENGALLWEVDCAVMVPGFNGANRTEIVAVRVPAVAEPKLQPFAPVPFERLEMNAYLSKGDLRVNLSAAGLAGAAAPRGSEQKAA